jgi:tetratricopeptide (TPR) repeat protein
VRRHAGTLLLASLLLCAFAASQEAERNFAAANELYRAGKYAEAAETYERVVANGYESAALYYNLGNARYKEGRFPAAILSYERARRLAPGDEDILHNLRLANLRIVDKIDPIPRLFFAEWWDALIGLASSSGWGSAAIASLWAAALFLAGFRLVRAGALQKILLFAGVAGIIVSAFAFTAGAIQDGRETSAHAAILFAPSAPVKSAPDARSTDLFVLHEGVKFDLLDSVGEWRKIRLADGKVGWLPAGDMQVI